VSVAGLALGHGINANMLFRWRRQYRAGEFGSPDRAPDAEALVVAGSGAAMGRETGVTLLPVQIRGADDLPGPTPGCVEVMFAGVTVRITGTPTPVLLRTVLDLLGRRS
jgi:transposase